MCDRRANPRGVLRRVLPLVVSAALATPLLTVFGLEALDATTTEEELARDINLGQAHRLASAVVTSGMTRGLVAQRLEHTANLGRNVGEESLASAYEPLVDHWARVWHDADPSGRELLLDAVATTDAGAVARALRRGTTTPAASGRIHGSLPTRQHRPVRYVAIVPDDYDESRSWPLHVALHGGGGSPIRTCEVNWRGEPAKDGVIVICPGVDNGYWWTPRGEDAVLSAVAFMKSRYNIDPDRVSIGGASSGGFGAWHAATKFPWLWSSVTPRCAATPPDPETLLNLHDVPAWMLHGERDSTIGIAHSRRSLAVLEEAGYDVRLSAEPNHGHAFMRHRNAEVAAWLDGQKREPSNEFRYKVPRRGPAPSRVHWLGVDWGEQRAAGTTWRGEVIRASARDRINIVRVETDADVAGFRVFLRRADADLRRPVRVVLNGETVFEGRADRTADMLLASWITHEDAGLLADAGVHVKLPTGRATQREATGSHQRK